MSRPSKWKTPNRPFSAARSFARALIPPSGLSRQRHEDACGGADEGQNQTFIVPLAMTRAPTMRRETPGCVPTWLPVSFLRLELDVEGLAILP